MISLFNVIGRERAAIGRASALTGRETVTTSGTATGLAFVCEERGCHLNDRRSFLITIRY